MSYLEKVVTLTKSQYNTLAGGGTVGTQTGLDDDYIYLTTDPTDFTEISGTVSTNQLPNSIPTSKLNVLTDSEVINLLQSVSSGGTVESPGTLDVFNETKDGLVPTPGSTANTILKSDGTWVRPNVTIEQLVDGDNIYQQVNTYLDNTLVKVSGSEKIITIWKNTGAVQQTFAAQTLSFASGLQPNKFNFIIIEYTIYTGETTITNDHIKTEIINVNSPYKKRLLTGRVTNNATTGARLVTLTNNDTEIDFQQAYWGTSANNRYIVPYTIYGIKL